MELTSKWLGLGMIAVGILVVINAAVAVRGIGELYDAQERVQKAQEIRVALERTFSMAKDAETGQRGFVLTGDPQYLKPYEAAVAALDDQVARLAGLTADERALRTRVGEFRGLLDEKLRELAETVALRRDQGRDAAVRLVMTNRGQALMDAMRRVVAEMDDIELGQLRQREIERTSSRNFAYAATIIAGVLVLFAAFAFGLLVRRYFTLQAKSAAEINGQRELLRTTLESIGDGVITTDVNGNVTSLNWVAQSLTGWSQDDAADKPLHEVFNIINETTREPVENPALRALRDGVITGLANHTLLVARDGSMTPIDDSAAPIRDALGNTAGAVLVFRDITERKAAEDALREGERRKDEFLATLAHELRNPLAPLHNALYIARHKAKIFGSRTEESDRLLDMMGRQVDQMSRLVDDLLDIARITRGRLELRLQRTDIADVVRTALETCEPVLAQGAHPLTVSLPEQPLYLQGDATRLSQVVCNLINNAVKYSAANSRIAVEAKRDDGDVVLTVDDNGIGIEPRLLERIFDMFSQANQTLERSKSGLGIGLTLARQIVAMHGGSIEARSCGLGRGSTFIVRLPASDVEDVASGTRIAGVPTVSPADENPDRGRQS